MYSIKERKSTFQIFIFLPSYFITGLVTGNFTFSVSCTSQKKSKEVTKVCFLCYKRMILRKKMKTKDKKVIPAPFNKMLPRKPHLRQNYVHLVIKQY